MRVTVRVVPVAGAAPPDGAPVTIEVRDVSRADAPSETVACAETVVGLVDEDADGAEAGEAGEVRSTSPTETGTRDIPAAVAVADLDVDDEALADGRDLSVWVRVDVSDQPRLTAGDWITMQSYPVRPGVDAVEVEIRPI